MRKPIEGDIWKHRNGVITMAFPLYPDHILLDKARKMFSLELTHCGNAAWTTVDEYNEDGTQNRFDNSQWDLIEYIGNPNDPTHIPEDDWSE